MTILNNENDGLYSELIVLFRAVAHSKKIKFDELIYLCSPISERVSGSKRLKNTLRSWEQLGLFIRDEENIQINLELFRQKKETADILTEKLPGVARRLLLKAENCLPLWNDDLDSDTEKGNGTSADFVRGLSWVLTQEIYNFPKVWEGQVEKIALDQLLSGRKIFSSGFRFNAFRHWARFLGFAAGESREFQIDPTTAIRDSLLEIFGNETEISGERFLSSLSKQLPVLDFGRDRQEVEASLNHSSWRAPAAGHLSMSLSFALKRLDANNTLRLKGRADTGSSFRLTGQNFRTWGGFESVVLLGKLS